MQSILNPILQKYLNFKKCMIRNVEPAQEVALHRAFHPAPGQLENEIVCVSPSSTSLMGGLAWVEIRL